MEMEAPQFDKGQTEGMCGNFDGVRDNDFNLGGDGRPHADETAFGESWR